MRQLLVVVFVCSCLAPAQVLANNASTQGQPQGQPPPPSIPTLPKMNHSEYMVKRGEQMFGAGNYAQALEDWLNAYRLGQDYKVLRLIAKAYRALGKYRQAYKVMRRYRELAPKWERSDITVEMHKLEACTVDVPTVSAVSLSTPGTASLEGGQMHHRLEISNPTGDQLEVVEVRAPELDELGIETSYVGTREVAPYSTVHGYFEFPARPARKLSAITITAKLRKPYRQTFAIRTSVNPVARMLLPDERWKQVALTVRGAYGVFPIDDTVFIDSARTVDMFVISVGVHKGFKKWWALEGDLTYGQTGTAVFNNLEIDGMTGDLSRRARFVRVLGAAVLRSGNYDFKTARTNSLFTARIGLGPQVISYDTSLATATGAVDIPEGIPDVHLLVSVGVGYTRRLGDHWSLGLSGSLNPALFVGGSLVTADVGMFARYGWQPSPGRQPR